jgi:hypothetical protein
MTMRESFEKFMKTKYTTTTETPWECWQAAFNMQQAEIDRLMLEYCPNEMSAEQVEEWGKHQRHAPDEFQDEQ